MKPYAYLFSVIFAAVSLAEPSAPATEAIVDQFCAASRQQARTLAGATMDVDIQASLPGLKKQGRLHALRHISALGRITYEKLFFEGDGTVKSNVIARYLTAEAQAQNGPQTQSMEISKENYKFHYKGMLRVDGRSIHILGVSPRKKRVGLFKGDIWIDAQTYLRVQESGYFVKSPSVFLRRVAFVRRYEIRDGISVPRQMESTVDTRLVGKAELHIAYSNFSLDGQAHPAGAEDGGQ